MSRPQRGLKGYDSFCLVLNPWAKVPVVHWHGWHDGNSYYTACGRGVGNELTRGIAQEITKNALQYGRMCKRCERVGSWPKASTPQKEAT